MSDYLGGQLGLPDSSRGLFKAGIATVAVLVSLPLASNWRILGRNIDSAKTLPPAHALPVASERIQQVSSYCQRRHFTGVTVAARASELAFERRDRLVHVFVEEGVTVKQDAPLAQVDTSKLDIRRQQVLAECAQAVAVLAELKAGPRQESIDVARADVNRLQAELTLQKSQLERRERLAVKGIVATDQLEQFDFKFHAATTRLEAAQRKLDELVAGTRVEKIAAQEAAVKRLDAVLSEIEHDIRQSTIRAPFDGRIAARFVDEGTLVTPAMPIVRLVEVGTLEARVGLPPEFADSLETSATYQIQVRGNSYAARFRTLLPELNWQTRTRTAVFAFEETASAEIVPAQIARLTLSRSVAGSGFWLPSGALSRAERGLWNVMALVPNGSEDCCQTERRIVELLHMDEDQMLVRGTLRDGDLVAVNGVHRIVAGQLVRAVPSAGSPAKTTMLTVAPPQSASSFESNSLHAVPVSSESSLIQ